MLLSYLCYVFFFYFKVKLYRDDLEQQRQLTNELRQQLDEQNKKIQQRIVDKENDFEFKLSQLESTVRNLEDELDGSKVEMRKLKDINFELELERDRIKRDYEVINKQNGEKQDLIDTMKSQLKQVKDEFLNHQRQLQVSLLLMLILLVLVLLVSAELVLVIL